MAQSLLRKTLAVFGLGGTTDDFEEFGSTANGSTVYTKDIATIQNLSAWTNGWRPALVSNKAPIIQDMNAVMYVHSYIEAYILQEGIPEYDSGTTYNIGSIVKLPYTGSGQTCQLFASKTDGNTGNALPSAPASNTNWAFLIGIVSGNIAVGSNLAFPQGTGIGVVGTNTNDDAVSGNVGEYVESIVQNQSAGTSAVYANITTVSLTAGDWDISAMILMSGNSATFTGDLVAGVSLFSGTTNTDQVLGKNFGEQSPPSLSTGACTITIANWRQKLSGTTTVYLKGRPVYGSGTPLYDAGLWARRRR